ncbi:nitrate ABC transporter permease [Gottfriedia luciferensis]|uniref:Nitrate ABC transporter permease n=1 Tax=Gottfriedia luciferensis TaxID=178774 RepID=A0ABX2ZKZ7_9BACI|nr:ABC transporter permease [Gottfriedia luciferensis]ODG90343.1 nitrate ABC transporter permease [Gottfriedia luciferensis]
MKSKNIKGWQPIVVILLFLICWQLSIKIWRIESWLLPGPIAIFKEGMRSTDSLLPHISSTIQLTIIGLLIGSLLGFLIAFLLHLIPGVREAFYPLLILSQNVPIIVLAPLLIIWFGFGVLPKLIIISLVCFFPVTVSALDGFRQTPSELINYMKMAGASKSQVFWKVELPFSLPSIFSGLKISATYSVMGAVISEWLGAKSGIGVYMTLASSSFRTDRVFVSIFIIMFLSMLFFFLIVVIERFTVKWKVKGVKRK